MTEAWSIFSQYLALKNPNDAQKSVPKIKSKRAHVLVKISVITKDLRLNLGTDESYSLSANTRIQGKKLFSCLSLDFDIFKSGSSCKHSYITDLFEF